MIKKSMKGQNRWKAMKKHIQKLIDKVEKKR